MKRKRTIKIKKQYFDSKDGNPFNSRVICNSEIVKTANRLAAASDIIILEIEKSTWVIGGVNISIKATKQDYEKFCQELIQELAPYIESFSI